MGYTHYFTTKSKPVTDKVWGKFCNITRAIIEASQVSICDGIGEGLPMIEKDCIILNGDASKGEDFETLHIDRTTPNDSAFCKTGRRPYDIVVVAILSVASTLKILNWSSDGVEKDGDFDEAKKLLDNLKG